MALAVRRRKEIGVMGDLLCESESPRWHASGAVTQTKENMHMVPDEIITKSGCYSLVG